MRRKIFSILLSVAMVIVMMPSMAFASSEDPNVVEPDYTWFNEEPYVITSQAQLLGFANIVNGTNLPVGKSQYSFSGKTVKLGTDIDLKGKADKQWTPINGFKGTFDGDGHIVSNLYVNGGTSGKGFGFFGNCNAEINNLTIHNAVVMGNSSLGVIIGDGVSKITNCHVTGGIYVGVTTNNTSLPNYSSSYVGGIAGHGYMTITNCSVTGEGTSILSGGRQVGGIIGFQGEGGMKVDGCSVKNITIDGKYCQGGIQGYVHYNNIVQNCTVTDVTVFGGQAQYNGLITAAMNSDRAIFKNNVAINSTCDNTGALYSTCESSVAAINADGTELYFNQYNVQTAIDADKGGIKFFANLTGNITIAEGKNVVIDLNGKILEGDITNNGTLTIKNGKVYGSVKGNVPTLIDATIEQAAAKVDSEYFMSVQAALDYVATCTSASYKYLHLMKDCAENLIFPVSPTIYISDHGYELTGTIVNNGMLKFGSCSGVHSATITNNGTLTFNRNSNVGFTVDNHGTLNINAGATYILNNITNADSATVSISGGTFNGEPDPSWIPFGYIAAENEEDNTYTVRLMTDDEARAVGAVARYGSSGYCKTVQEAIQKGAVHLIANSNEEVTKTGAIDLYCDSYTFTGSLSCPGKTLYIDNGTAILDNIECGTFYGGYETDEANITVKNGTATNIKVAQNANVTIEGGTYTGSIAMTSGGTGSLTIKGGTFSSDPTAYVAPGSWAVESNGLWIVESEHKLTKTEEKAATCTEAGNNAYWTCETCKKVFSNEAGTTETTVKEQTIPALGHDYSESYTVDRMPTCTEAGSMSKHCTRCNAKTGSISIAATGHSFGTKASLIKKSDATCTEAAQYYVQCDNCIVVSNDKAVAVGEALGHDYSTEWTVDKEANCQEEGIRSHHCTRCDAKADEEAIPVGEHAFNEKASSVKKSDATCAEAAQYYVQCDFCDAVSDSKTVSVGEALPHSFTDKASSTVASEATCTEAAQYYVQCDVCGTASDSLTVTVGEALGHNYSEEWTVDKEATCTEAGSRSHHCTRCDAKTDVEEIAVLPHSFNEKASASKKSDATCTEAAQYYVQCDNCDAVSDSKTVTVGEALGHTIKHVPAKEASYTEIGNKEYYECTVCGEYFADASGNTVISDKSSVLIEQITETTTETTPEGDVVTTDKTTDIATGTVTESTTTEKNDGTTVENIVVTDKDGNTQSTTDIVTNPDGSKSEVTTDTKTETTEDGSVVKTENKVTVETDAEGNKTEVTVEKENVAAADGSTSEKVVTTDKTAGTVTENVTTEKADGTKVESTTVTDAEGNQQSTTTTTNADLSKEIVENNSYNNSFDNKVETETKTTVSATGETTVEQTATIDTKLVGTITVNTTTDGEGNVTEATAEYTRSGKDVTSGVQAYLNGNHAKQIADVLGQDVDDVVIKANITSASGKDAFTVTANAADLTAGNKLYIVGVGKNGKKTLVNAKTYNVTNDGSVYVTMNDEANYQLVSKEEKAALVKDIKSTIAAAAATKTIAKGKTSTMALKKTLNMDNVKSITYTSSNKSVATVSKTGKITAKSKGTAIIKATVTLNDGSKKTVSTKVTVK